LPFQIHRTVSPTAILTWTGENRSCPFGATCTSTVCAFGVTAFGGTSAPFSSIKVMAAGGRASSIAATDFPGHEATSQIQTAVQPTIQHRTAFDIVIG
jgi:hypothetical protein